MNKDASKLIGDILIQLNRVAWNFSPDSQYRKSVTQKFLEFGYTLASTNANSKDWKKALQEANELWKDIVTRLPYVGYSLDGSREKDF